MAGCGQQSPTGPSTTRIASTDKAAALPCHSGQLDAELVAAGSAMSQPFVSVKLRNRSAKACGLKGYAGLEAIGHRKGERNQQLRLDVRQGSVYERPTPP